MDSIKIDTSDISVPETIKRYWKFCKMHNQGLSDSPKVRIYLVFNG